MDLSEKDLEDMIWEAAKTYEGRVFLGDRGLILSGTLFRQVELGDYGVADLISFTYNHHPVPTSPRSYECEIDIYELKQGKFGLDALGQALRYKDAIQHFLSLSNLSIMPRYNIHLIGYDIDHSKDFLSIARAAGEPTDGTDSSTIRLYEYRFGFDGIQFRLSTPDSYQRINHGKPSHKVFSYKALRAIAREELRFITKTEHEG